MNNYKVTMIITMLLTMSICAYSQDPRTIGMGQYLCELTAQELIEFTPGSYVLQEYSTPPVTSTSMMLVQMAWTVNIQRIAQIINQRILYYSDIHVTTPWTKDGAQYFMKMGIIEQGIYVVVMYDLYDKTVALMYVDK